MRQIFCFQEIKLQELAKIFYGTDGSAGVSINHPIRLLRRHLPYPGKAIHQAASPPFPLLPFQALRASFPEGKPTLVRFEAIAGLTDETYLH